MKSLLRSRGTLDGRGYGVYETHDLRIRVFDDARTCMKVIQLFADRDLMPEVKAEILLRLLFPDPDAVAEAAGDDLGAILGDIVWEICGLDITGEHDTDGGKQLFDWDADEEYIRTTMLMAYGKPIEELASHMTYRELVSLIFMAPHETPMGQAIYYRTAKPPKRDKHNGEQVEEFKKRQRFWQLRTPETEQGMKAESDAMASAFAAFKQNAKG